MPAPSTISQLLHRDGTSQAMRRLEELAPGYVSVDERTLKDLLAFAREYAKELQYFCVEDGKVEAAGDWSGFIDADMDLDEVVSFVSNPEKFTSAQAEKFQRSHLVLFLTFLKVLQHTQHQLNTITARHLDFYFQQVLRMTKKQGVPDHVNVLVDLTDGTDAARLLAGTQLNAGVDSEGNDLVFTTDADVVINQAQIARLQSLFTEKRVIGIREARVQHTGPYDESIERMFKMALGSPFPGADLPAFPTGSPIDFERLTALQGFVDFTRTGLFMEWSELRQLLQLHRQRIQADHEWDEINRKLVLAGKKRTGNENFQINAGAPRDFDANFLASTGVETRNERGQETVYDGVTEVENVYDLFEQFFRESVKEFIQQKLFFENVDDFTRMMQLKVMIDNQWEAINVLLEEAGQKKRGNPAFKLNPADPTDFATNFQKALGKPVYPTPAAMSAIADVHIYFARLEIVEAYFSISAENYSFLMAVVMKEDDAGPREWERVYDILADAHRQKVYAQRRQALDDIRKEAGFDGMLANAARELSSSGLTPYQLMLEYVNKDEDAQFLARMNDRAVAMQRITAAQWDRLINIVEQAQRTFLTAPVARREEWLNLYPYADATVAAVSTDSGADTPRWNTFGASQSSVAAGSPAPTAIGYAISSPVLDLSQGQRTVSLTLGFGEKGFKREALEKLFADDTPFNVEISTEKGWISPTTTSTALGDYGVLCGRAAAAENAGLSFKAIQLTLTFNESVDPMAPPAQDAQIQSEWPVLRLMLRQKWHPGTPGGETGRYLTDYQVFKDLELHRAHIRVQVNGLLPLQLQNDSSRLAPAKPFEPFGTRAIEGARFFFGHPELNNKALETMNLNLVWMGGPDHIITHYKNYPKIKSNTAFSVKVSLMDNRIELPLSKKTSLFAGADTNKAHTISFRDLPAAVNAGRAGYPYERLTRTQLDDDLLNWNRYFLWELNGPDFQHEEYPRIVTRSSVALAAATSTTAGVPDPSIYQVNPPYTPKVKSMTIDYGSSIEIDLENYVPEQQIDKNYHIQPFGYDEAYPEALENNLAFLPKYEHEGELYIGLEGVAAPQTLSLLFQMAEGSADPDQEPPPVEWHVLHNNRWLSLDDSGRVLSDNTRGLINSGIVTFDLGPVEPSTLLPEGYYWIRAAVPNHTDGVCDTIAIHAQAVSATFADQDNAPDHLNSPLAPESITDLKETHPKIAGIHQPYTSYGGKTAELDENFYTRISERLRHKNRAVTTWDYEHMLLERFPELYKVKCLPAAPDRPGEMTVITIPDIRNKLPFNPFEPKAPADLMADIQTYLDAHIPASATVKVKNARYEAVKVRFAVRFKDGYNEGFYKQQLNDELNRFLSPWAYDEGADIVIGGRIYANVIINFIEERPYVDYAAEIRLFSSTDGRHFRMAIPSGGGGYWVESEHPDSVLVAARHHEIDMITDDGYEDENYSGLNYTKVELDFMVGGK